MKPAVVLMPAQEKLLLALAGLRLYFETFDRRAITITRWYFVSGAGRSKACEPAGA